MQRSTRPNRIFQHLTLVYILVGGLAVGSQFLAHTTSYQAQAAAIAAFEQPLEASLAIPLPSQQPNIFRLIQEYVNHKQWTGNIKGITRFRGNPQHTFYGTGPLHTEYDVTWRFPERPMCRLSTAYGETKQWCGTGWTGQPVIWERPDGITELIFGAYDGAVHFVNAETGERTRPDFPTGDIIKGSVALDPDGYPLIYFGSRDNKLRIVALDRETPTELWSLHSHDVPERLWNDDWDSTPLIIDDIMFQGGENGWFFAIQLNRIRNESGHVSIEPEILSSFRGWNKNLLERIQDTQVSIESSSAAYGTRVYFASSGGRIMGINMQDLGNTHKDPIVFEYETGDDTDASIVIDTDGMLYIAVEQERDLDSYEHRAQLLKLNPYQPDDPLIWSVNTNKTSGGKGGFWATPALSNGILYAPSHGGELFVIDAKTGDILQELSIPTHAWSSPNVIEDSLALANCDGSVRMYDIDRKGLLSESYRFTLPSGACIESSPAIWNGDIYVGSRDGYFYKIGPA